MILESILFTLLVLTVFLLIFFVFLDKQVSKKLGGKALIFISILFIYFSFIFKPESFIRWDLIEHFKVLANMRSGGWEYATQESQYADLFVYNTFAYIISLLPTSSQNLLSTIPLIIDFAIVAYIYKQIFEKYLPDANGKSRILSVLLWLFTFGIKLAITGIRCSLAVSIATLAIYLELIQKKKKILPILLYLIAMFIHNFALVVISVRLLTMLKKPILIMASSLIVSLTLEPLSRLIVTNVNNQYIAFSFRRILETVEKMSFTSALQSFNGATLLVYICVITIAIYLFVISTKLKQNNADGSYCKIVANFTATVGAVAIGLSFNYLYLERFMYLMSYALLMITPIHNNNKIGIKKENIFIIPIALFVFFFNDIYTFMVNYVGNYFLSF